MQRPHALTGVLRLLCVLVLSLLAHIHSSTTVAAEDNLLTVHIIAHSHCDPGWLNTFEGYYTQEVRTILDAVLRELSNNPHRKFVWSEVSFFNRWYETLGVEAKITFKRLVRDGQIEFVNGGWVQNDEANPDPTAMINQMATGHEYLLKNFGAAPKIAWQIDPFGHSSVTPTLWSLMGFEALVINRIHHNLKDQFKSRRGMEFIWRGADVGQKTDMFTHVLHTHYSAPPGFDWEEGAPYIEAGSVNHRAAELANIMRHRSQAYQTRNLLVPFGDDFKFKSADRQFGNMDKLIEYINKNSAEYGMRIQYSTLSDYFTAVSQQQQVKFPVITGDFFPYADNEDSYWTGYYTTRPLLKQKSRKLNYLLRACEQLVVLVRSSPHSNEDTLRAALPNSYWESKLKEIERARMETALFLHHDAITGTSRTNVVADYQSRMDSSAEQLISIQTRMIEHLLTKETFPTPTFTHDPIVFDAVGVADGGSSGVGDDAVFHPIVLYNSLAWVRRELTTIRVGSRSVQVYNSANQEIECQVDIVWTDLSDSEITPSTTVFQVSFIAEMPPLGATTYFVKVSKDSADGADPSALVTNSQTTVFLPSALRSKGKSSYNSKYLSYELPNAEEQYIENTYMKVWFSEENGMVKNVQLKKGDDGETLSEKPFSFEHHFGRYSTSRSGAYIFRAQQGMERFTSGETITMRVTRGPIVSTVSVKFRGLDVITSLVGDDSVELGQHLRIVSTVNTDHNTELISHFSSPQLREKTGHAFQTHNGLDFLQRYSKGGNEAANFYPSVLGARVFDEKKEHGYTVFTSHSMACGSQGDGELQFMLHRSLAQDDGRGLAEAVIDTSRLDVPMWISFNEKLTTKQFKRNSIRLNNPVQTFYKLPVLQSSDSFMKEDHITSVEAWNDRQLTQITPLKQPLPDHVHLLTLLSRDSVSDDYVLRLQHLDSTPESAWVGSFSEFLEDVYQVSEVRRASLSLNTVLPMSGKRTRVMQKFQASTEAPTNAYMQIDTSVQSSATDSQNTNEEGVFLSQAALEKLRQDQAAKQAAAAASRRLLEVEQESDENILAFEEESTRYDPAHISNAFHQARHLLSTPSSSSPASASPLFHLGPLQIQTYLLKITGAEWAESQVGVQVGVGAKEDGSASTVTKATSAKPRSKPKPTLKPSPVTDAINKVIDALGGPSSPSTRTNPNLSDGLAGDGVPNRPGYMNNGGARDGVSKAAVDSDPSNVLNGHEHTVIPGRTREAWRLIPSRWEYIFILFASLIGVAFFMHALRIMSRTTAASGELLPTRMVRSGKKSSQ